MPRPTRDPAALVEAARSGDRSALARALSLVEQGGEPAREVGRLAHPHGGRAYTVGVTGAPGGGKSTLVSALVGVVRAAGEAVAVLAIDPSSPFSGGAILGDRVRMGDHALDEGVFIRSMATRGHLGGLAVAAPEAVRVLAAAGYPWVLLETVGVGQVELDVTQTVDTTVVVVNPGWGDDVQAAKAGLLEIADVHVVNKSDREGAHKIVSELREMLRLSHREAGQWNVPIVQTVAATGAGAPELADRFDEHRAWMERSGEGLARERRNAATRIRWMAEELVLERLRPGLPDFDEAVDAVTERRCDPVSAARRLVGRP